MPFRAVSDMTRNQGRQLQEKVLSESIGAFLARLPRVREEHIPANTDGQFFERLMKPS